MAEYLTSLPENKIYTGTIESCKIEPAYNNDMIVLLINVDGFNKPFRCTHFQPISEKSLLASSFSRYVEDDGGFDGGVLQGLPVEFSTHFVTKNDGYKNCNILTFEILDEGEKEDDLPFVKKRVKIDDIKTIIADEDDENDE